jgi:hypothetical protein
MQIFRKHKKEKKVGKEKLKEKKASNKKDEGNIFRSNGKNREKNITQKIK